MVTDNARIHQLLANGAAATVDLYFIGNSIDCTDDSAVRASASVLHSADIEMNGGLSWTNVVNKGEDIEIGTAVSSVMEASFANRNGNLNDFPFGRCKVYGNVYDPQSGNTLTFPLGVYIIDTPKKRRVSTIAVTAYDQMQRLDTIADDWWDSLDFTNGLTLSEIFAALAAQCGVTAKNASTITNGSYSYTARPFEVTEMTYRDILAQLAGAAAGVARFDQNGYLEIAQFTDVNITLSLNTSPTPVMSFDIAEYEVAQIDKLSVVAAENDVGVTVGTGTNAYTMMDNGFMSGATAADITARATPIYNVLHGYAAYTPMTLKTIADPTIEAGDIVHLAMGETVYDVPVFRYKTEWHGGGFRGEIHNSGNPQRLEQSQMLRAEYRSKKLMHLFEVTLDALRSRINDVDGNGSTIEQFVDDILLEVSEKVGDDEIVSKINLSPEQIKIIASKIALEGLVTINNGFAIDTDGKMTANGATINGTVISQTVDSDGVLWKVVIEDGGIHLYRNNMRAVDIADFYVGNPGIRVYNSRGLVNGEMTVSGFGNTENYGSASFYNRDASGNVLYRTDVTSRGVAVYKTPTSGGAMEAISRLVYGRLELGSTTLTEAALAKLLTPQTLTVSNSYVSTAWFAKIGGVKTVCIYDLLSLPQNQNTTIIAASDMVGYLPTIPIIHDVTGLSGGERVRIYIDTDGIHAYNFSQNNTQIYVGVNIAYI